MAIFQPTWVFPDMRCGLGQGTVDVTNGIDVSWQVNGTSDLSAWQVYIYKNDSESTLVYRSGVTIPFPFPQTATDRFGNPRRQTNSISATELANAGMVNGEEYKLVIEQHWVSYSGSEQTTNITVQNSPSVFITRAAPTVRVAIDQSTTLPYDPSQRSRNFTGYYTQEQGDALNWARWQVAVMDGSEASSVIYDTGNIYGMPELSFQYDGFLPDITYGVKLSVQTQNGVEVDSDWVTFSVEFTSRVTGGYVHALCVRETNAVKVTLSAIGEIVGTASGEYSLSDGIVTLPSGSSIAWNTINESEQMNFEAPWSVLWKGALTTNDMTMFRLEQESGAIECVYDASEQTISLLKNGEVLAYRYRVINSPTVTIVLTDTKFYIRMEYMGGGIYPSNSLYPSAETYPLADDTEQTETYNFDVSYTQETITGVCVFGDGSVDYLEIKKGNPTYAVIQSAWANGDYEPSSNNGCYFRAVFESNINAEILDIGNETLSGCALYRAKDGESLLTHIADFALTESEIYDYSACSQQGDYTYYLFLLTSGNAYASNPVISEPINPCFWDWCLMECSETDTDGIYTVDAEYRFGKNLSSSDMSNNNAPNVTKNFTRYPTVQLVPQQYKSGSLTSLIGVVNESGVYSDGIDLAEAIYELSLSTKALFLKNRKGRLMRVNISGPITMKTTDNCAEQAQTATIPWVESGDATGVSLYSLSSARQT